MIITSYTTLTPHQKEEIAALEGLSFKKEGLENHAFLSNELNFNKDMPCFYLCHEENRLIGFLTTFVPTRSEAEIIGVTHPDYQRQSVFSSLLQHAKEELAKYQVMRILYCVEPKSSQASYVLEALHVSDLSFSEYRMELTPENAPKKLPNKESLSLKRVDQENKNDFAKLRMEAFDQEEEDATIEKAASSDDRMGYLLYDGSTPVGAFAIGLEEETFLYGVCTAKRFRGKGYGKYLMEKALELGFKADDKIVLDVDSKNPIALNLYKSYGFKTTFQVDYYAETLIKK